MRRVPAIVSFCALLAAQSSSSRRIAFFSEHAGGLYVLDYANGRIQALDVGRLDVGNLAYSHTAALLAFEGSKGHDESPSLYLLHLNNGKKELIHKANRNQDLYRPKFDPDGQRLYAVNYFAGVFRYSLSQKTWEVVRVSGTRPLNPQGLSFSKSGRKVAISPGDFKGFLIANVVNGGFLVERHVLTEFSSCISPEWIGDTAIVFAGRRRD